jgi:hypothetical protein
LQREIVTTFISIPLLFWIMIVPVASFDLTRSPPIIELHPAKAPAMVSAASALKFGIFTSPCSGK